MDGKCRRMTYVSAVLIAVTHLSSDEKKAEMAEAAATKKAEMAEATTKKAEMKEGEPSVKHGLSELC